jgi:hypothetical protein
MYEAERRGMDARLRNLGRAGVARETNKNRLKSRRRGYRGACVRDFAIEPSGTRFGSTSWAILRVQCQLLAAHIFAPSAYP